MTKYLEKKFSVNVGGQAYGEGWDAIFGKKEENPMDMLVEETEELGLYPWQSTSDIRKQVGEFHHAMGQPVLDTPQVPPADRLRLRLHLIAEEFGELLDACGVYPGCMSVIRDAIDTVHPLEVDLAEVTDALGDLDYVIEGMRLECGVNGKQIADEIHRSNMSKLDDDGKPVLREGDAKVIKGPNYSPPDIVGELRKQGWDGR